MGSPFLTPAPFYADETPAPPGSSAVWVRAEDGVRLRLGHLGRGPRGTVLCFPGRTEYLEKYGHVAARFLTAGYGMVAVDWRGQGLADRLLPDRDPGHVERFADYQQDVAALLAYARHLDMPRPWHLLAHSMGGAIGLRALGQGLPVASAAFSAPMWGLTMTRALRPLARWLPAAAEPFGIDRKMVPGTARQSYVLFAAPQNNLLTNDAAMFEWFREHVRRHPDLALGGPTLRWLGEAYREFDTFVATPPPPVPVRVYLGAEEAIVSPGRIRALTTRWPRASVVDLPGARHEVLMEIPATRNRVIDDATAFFDACAV